MNIVARLFWLPFNNRVVDVSIAPSLAQTLGTYLRARGFARIQITEAFLDEMLSEIIERASAEESDNKPRYRGVWHHMELVAEAAKSAYRNHDYRDEEVSVILRRHGFL